MRIDDGFGERGKKENKVGVRGPGSEDIRKETKDKNDFFSSLVARSGSEAGGALALLGVDLVGGDALLLLGVAVGDAAVELAAVGRVGALVLLDVTRPLGRGAEVLERGPVHLERAPRCRADDGDGGRADRT